MGLGTSSRLFPDPRSDARQCCAFLLPIETINKRNIYCDLRECNCGESTIGYGQQPQDKTSVLEQSERLAEAFLGLDIKILESPPLVGFILSDNPVTIVRLLALTWRVEITPKPLCLCHWHEACVYVWFSLEVRRVLET